MCKKFLITSLLIIFQAAYQLARIVARKLGLPTHCPQDALRQWEDAIKAYIFQLDAEPMLLMMGDGCPMELSWPVLKMGDG